MLRICPTGSKHILVLDYRYVTSEPGRDIYANIKLQVYVGLYYILPQRLSHSIKKSDVIFIRVFVTFCLGTEMRRWYTSFPRNSTDRIFDNYCHEDRPRLCKFYKIQWTPQKQLITIDTHYFNRAPMIICRLAGRTVLHVPSREELGEKFSLDSVSQ